MVHPRLIESVSDQICAGNVQLFLTSISFTAITLRGTGPLRKTRSGANELIDHIMPASR